ncbi:MAG TPA: hypothetical protein DER23_05790 [Clostridiales bacterium]|jgi:hypothetical protein|nr:hypothetical protein [Clostridiales bacterium]
MKRIVCVVLLLVVCLNVVSCQKDMTAQVKKQLQFNNTRVSLKIDTFHDTLTMHEQNGIYTLSGFETPTYKDLTISISPQGVSHTLADIVLDPIAMGTDRFLSLGQLLTFLKDQTYTYRAADVHENDPLCIVFDYEKGNVSVYMFADGTLQRVEGNGILLKIIGR